MRRKDRMLTEAKTLSILEKGGHGILSVISPEGGPYGVPLNYCLLGGCIYFHCAAEGRMVGSITANPGVSFCVLGKSKVIPDKFSTDYESCVVQGRVSESFGEEKQSALEGLIRKYSADFIAEGLKYIERCRDQARVFKITVESISGKARG
mgnify:CR=1 FL=1|jgi:nitroimidazol reductase NimA-like FMN-containing flavoprotein (pyridoxamine 5'-phosphate oxidase superfamily)